MVRHAPIKDRIDSLMAKGYIYINDHSDHMFVMTVDELLGLGVTPMQLSVPSLNWLTPATFCLFDQRELDIFLKIKFDVDNNHQSIRSLLSMALMCNYTFGINQLLNEYHVTPSIHDWLCAIHSAAYSGFKQIIAINPAFLHLKLGTNGYTVLKAIVEIHFGTLFAFYSHWRFSFNQDNHRSYTIVEWGNLGMRKLKHVVQKAGKSILNKIYSEMDVTILVDSMCRTYPQVLITYMTRESCVDSIKHVNPMKVNRALRNAFELNYHDVVGFLVRGGVNLIEPMVDTTAYLAPSQIHDMVGPLYVENFVMSHILWYNLGKRDHCLFELVRSNARFEHCRSVCEVTPNDSLTYMNVLWNLGIRPEFNALRYGCFRNNEYIIESEKVGNNLDCCHNGREPDEFRTALSLQQLARLAIRKSMPVCRPLRMILNAKTLPLPQIMISYVCMEVEIAKLQYNRSIK
jgi:hypothetical protein